MTDIEIYNLIRAQIYPLRGAYINIGSEKIYFNQFIPYSEIKNIRKLYE